MVLTTVPACQRSDLANSQPTTLNYTYTYDNASRLASVTNGLNTAAYTYLANSPLVSQILFNTTGTTRMTTTKQYDLLNRLQQGSSVSSASGASPATFNYSYNNANQRTRNLPPIRIGIIKTLYPAGTKLSTGFDAASRRVAETNQDGLVTLFGYDGAGRLISVTNALGTPDQSLVEYLKAVLRGSGGQALNQIKSN